MLQKAWFPILLAVALLLGGCSAESDEQPRKVVKPIDISVNAPDRVPKKQDTVEIKGMTENANRLMINDQETMLIKDGSFATDVPLQEGKNEFKVVAYYVENGKELAKKEEFFTVYKEDPLVTLTVDTEITARKNSTPITGITEPGAKVTLYQDSKKLATVTAKDNGEFTVTLPTSKSSTFTLEAKKAGFKTNEVTVSVERVLSAAEKKAQYKKSCKTISYKKLKKNADRYKGDRYKARGQIIQIMENDDTTVMRIAVTKDSWGYWNYDDVIYVEYEGT
ncbi:MAG: Ig-like domain-containing protein, partial [Bacillales bacterium]